MHGIASTWEHVTLPWEEGSAFLSGRVWNGYIGLLLVRYSPYACLHGYLKVLRPNDSPRRGVCGPREMTKRLNVRDKMRSSCLFGILTAALFKGTHWSIKLDLDTARTSRL